LTPRRQLTVAVVACTAAATLALFAASRTWTVQVRARPAPLPPVAEARRGADLAPALPALAFVALAGAGGLVAARRRGRPAVGVLLVAAGAGMALSAAVELRRGILPATCALAGAAVVAVGVETLRRGRGWPALGTTYDRPRGQQPTPGDESDMWEAIDRRIDPTQDAMS